VHFDELSLFSDNQAEKIGNPKENCEICKRAEKKPTQLQILCHEIERNLSKDRTVHEGDNRSVWDEFINFVFTLVTIYLGLWFVRQNLYFIKIIICMK
jgi:hypothetical protein